MPGPALYVGVGAVVVGVAAAVVFKQHVYDPHVSPKIKQWAGAYAAYRSERRRRRTSPHSHDSVGRSDSPDDKSSVELERLVEREMHTLDPDGNIRRRTTRRGSESGNGVEMMEKPNGFIPFAPLSPTRAHSPSLPPLNALSTRTEATLPIGRLPTPDSDHTPSASISRASRPFVHTPVASPEEASRSPTSPTSSESPSLVSAPASSRGELELTFPTASRAASTHEYDFVHPSSNASRAQTPFTDTRSTTPFTDARSTTPFTDAAPSDSGASLDGFLGSDADSDVEFLRSPSPRRRGGMSEAASEEWERVSEAGGPR